MKNFELTFSKTLHNDSFYGSVLTNEKDTPQANCVHPQNKLLNSLGGNCFLQMKQAHLSRVCSKVISNLWHFIWTSICLPLGLH